MKLHQASRLTALVLLVKMFALGNLAWADTFSVDNAGSDGPDANPGDGVCQTANGACTFEAAIGEANQRAGAHTITFSVPAVHLTAPLPIVTAPVVIIGTSGPGGRVDIDGNMQQGGIEFAETTTALHPTGARGSSIDSFVVRNFNDSGITLSGHGYTVNNCYVGVTADGASASPNASYGIDISGTIDPSNMPNLPSNFNWAPAQIAAQLGALFPNIPPNRITLNVVSGNDEAGIRVSGFKAAVNIIEANIVGSSADALSAIPNGNSGGGNHPGIRIDANAYANIIGPDNVISGNDVIDTDDGIDAVPAAVAFPNFIAGNSIGLGADATANVGNGGSGIKVDTHPDMDGTSPDNPTGYSLFIVGNIISDNKGVNGGGIDSPNGPNAGIAITGGSTRVKVIANLIGLGSFGGVLSMLPDFGNAGDGVFVSASDNEIGGAAAAEYNVIAGNGRHGIMINGNNTTSNLLRNNYVGVPDPTMLDVLTLGNAGDGIHIDAASSNSVGGTAQTDSNVIAANGRHGIAMRNGGTNNGWSNLLQRNRIYANTALGIDLERALNVSDPIPDPLDPDPNTGYANYGQNQPWICSQQPTDPAPCGGVVPPAESAAGTTVGWMLATSPNATIRIEFFARSPTGQTFLDERTITTDAAGLAAGAECSGGLCSSVVGSGIATSGQLIEMTATDVTNQDVPPTGDANTGPANNTSEFSNAVAVGGGGPGSVFAISNATANEGNAGITTFAFTVTRAPATGAASVDFTVTDATASASDNDFAPVSATVNFADGVATQTIAVNVIGDTTPEGNETFSVVLANPSVGASIGQGTGTGTIVNDDAGGGGGPGAAAVPAPTLSQWGLACLGGISLLLGLVALRRRRSP